jgi:hypothetical protein
MKAMSIAEFREARGETAGLADEIFAAVIAAIALLAIVVDIRRARVSHKKSR